jgi:O-methyltransferase
LSFSQTIRSTIKDVSFKTGIYNQLFFGVYPYMYEPSQLVCLVGYVKAAGCVPGCFVEARCAYGATTVFLNKFMNGEMIARDYYAIDTFSGFLDEHVEHEVKNKGKSVSLRAAFTANKKGLV